jgi:CHAT domain-containing protein/Tfp pilus assembly protein PilF
LLGLSSASAAQDEDLNQHVLQLYQAGRYVEALPLAKRALAIYEGMLGPGHPQVATALNNLALLYKAQGDYKQAWSLHLRALAIREKALGPKHPAVAVSLHNLASLIHDLGDQEQAVVLYQRALAIKEETLGPEHSSVASSLEGLAMLYQEQGKYRQAGQLLRRSLAIREKTLGPEHPDIANSLNNLAALYQEQGDYKQAEPLYQRALAIREKAFGLDHSAFANTLEHLASLHHEQRDYGRAEPLYHRALAIYEKVLGAEHPLVAVSLNNLAAFYYDQGDYGRAVNFLQRGSEVAEKNIALTLSIGSQQQKQLYLDKFKGETYATVSLHVQDAPQNADAACLALTVILRHKGRTLDASTDQIAALRNHAAPTDKKLFDQLAAIQSRLATLQLSGAGDLSPAARQAEMERLAAEQEWLEDAIGHRSATFRATSRTVTLDVVRQAVPTDAALVELFVYYSPEAKVKTGAQKIGKPHYVAYVLHRADDAPQFVDLGEAALIDAEVERLRVVLKDSKRADFQSIARVVDERIMRPVRKLLGQTRRVLLSPDGALNLIPFAALVDENSKYLGENYSFTYLTSGRDLLRLQAQAESRNAPSVLANPLYDLPANKDANPSSTQSNENQRSLDFTLLNYKPLPGTAEEAAALGKLWPNAQVLTQDKATESALKQVRSPRILHIATHGFFLADQPRDLPAGDKLRRATIDTFEASPLSNTSPLPARWENPLLRSGLVLAGVKQQQSGAGEDGVLTALEAAGLDLWGTKLVVLSACETGLGDVQNGAGVYGLRRALVLAGSQTQVMSLWKVSDAGTRDLMTAYYTRLQAGEGRTEALRQVQLAMLRGELKPTQDGADYRHPYYWAAFIPSGDWRSMDGKDVETSSPLVFTAIVFLVIGVFIALLVFLIRRRNVKRVT